MFHWCVMSMAGEGLIFYGFVVVLCERKYWDVFSKQLHFVFKNEVEVNNGRR